VWGWLLLASSALSLLSFSCGMVGTLATRQGGGISAGAAVLFLAGLATGIGFVTGGSWSWYLGLLLAIGGVASGAWYLAQVEGPGAAEAWIALGLLWLGPPLLLLLCLFLPASLRWRRGAGVPVTWPAPPPPGSTPLAERRSYAVPLALAFAIAIVGAAILWALSRGADVPTDAEGFPLVRSWTVEAVI
jgi:hypothetical protein